MLPSFHELSLQQLSIEAPGERSARANARRRSARRRSFYLTRDRARENADDLCAICQEQLEDETPKRELPCAHQFHEACIHLWLIRAPICPTCKSPAPRTREEEEEAETLAAAELAAEFQMASVPERFFMALDADRIDLLTSMLETEVLPLETLGIALLEASRSGNLNVVRLIVRSRTMSEEILSRALEEASLYGHAAVVRMLVMAGPIKIVSIGTSLKDASRYGHKAVVRRLLSAKSALPLETIIKSLGSAVKNGHAAIVTLILATELIPESEIIHLIMVATIMNDEDVVSRFLVNSSEDLRILRLPLTWAANHGYKEIVEILLNTKGISKEVLNEAREAATNGGNTEIVALVDAYTTSDSAL